MAAVFVAGKGDNRATWNDLLEGENVIHELVTNNATPNAWRNITIDNIVLIYMYAQIRMTVMAITSIPIMIAYTLAEIMAFCVPNQAWLPQAQADARIINDVNAYFPVTPKLPNLWTNNNFHNAVNPAHAHAATLTALDLTQANPGINNVDVATEAIRILADLKYPTNRRTIGTTLYMIFVSSITKMGNVTDRYIEKIVTSISMEVGTQLDEQIYEMDTIRSVYGLLKGIVTSANIAALHNHWTAVGFFPANALRLRLIVAQMAGEGLTALSVIKEAMTKYPDFGWDQTAMLIPTDFTNADAAFQLVGADEYYGFNADLGAAKSTNYKNLAWVCKELLRRKGGKTSLRGYKGWVRVPEQHQALEALVDAYVNAPPAGAPTQAHTNSVNALIASQTAATGVRIN
jgi:hypothetical protein